MLETKYMVFQLSGATSVGLKVFETEKEAEDFIKERVTNSGTGIYYIQKVWMDV